MHEALAAHAFRTEILCRQLDKPQGAIIDQPARSLRLDSGERQNHLRCLGFPPPLDGLTARTGSSKWTLPAAGRPQAEVGLLCMIGVLEREVRQEIERAALRPAQSKPTRIGR